MSHQKQGSTYDHSDAFDKHLKVLDQARNAPESEKQAAINVYERLVMARKILQTTSPAQQTNELLISIFEQLNLEARSLAPNVDAEQ